MRLRRYFLIVALLLTAVTPFAVLAQDSSRSGPAPPDVAYRTYFEAAPVATDGEAALRPYYTREALGTLLAHAERESRSTQRRIRQKRQFFEEAQIDQIEMTELVAEGSEATARLRVDFSAKDPASQESATVDVIMKWEEGQWKIAHEEGSLVPLPEDARTMRYAEPPSAVEAPSTAEAAATAATEDCPAERTYGDAEAATQLVLAHEGMTRRIGFEGAVVVLRGRLGEQPWLLVRFPAFGPEDLLAQNASYRYGLSVDDFDAQTERQIADLERSGPVAPRGFDCFPTADFSNRLMGQLVIQRYEAPADGSSGRLAARFDTGEDRGGDDARVRAQVDTRRFVDLRLRPVSEGNVVVRDGVEHAAARGYASYNPNEERLRIELEYTLDSGAPNGALFTVPDFPGRPGVYMRDMGFGEVQLAIIDAFDGETGLRGEVRTVAEDDLPQGTLTPDEARQIAPVGDDAGGRFAFDATAIALWPRLAPVHTGAVYRPE